jgi:hypothetical protein
MQMSPGSPVPYGRHFNESHTPAVDGLSSSHVDIDGRV